MNLFKWGVCIAAICLSACTQRPFKAYVGESNFADDEYAFRKIPLPSCHDTLQFRSWVFEATKKAHCSSDRIDYNSPAPDVYELLNELSTGDSLSMVIQGFELRNGDSILFSKTYSPPAKWNSGSTQLYCGEEGCRSRLDKRDSINPCKPDSILSLSTSGAFQLPVVDRIYLRESIRVKNHTCDTLVDVEERMNFERWPGTRALFVP